MWLELINIAAKQTSCNAFYEIFPAKHNQIPPLIFMIAKYLEL
jgi:hypothetical protein